MGCSYRNSLNRGDMPEWEGKIRSAIGLISEVYNDLWECAGDDGQFDNAADDGALRGKLSDAMNILRSEIPMTPEEKVKRTELLEAQLRALKGEWK